MRTKPVTEAVADDLFIPAITSVPIASINDAPYNPRTITSEEMNSLKASIMRFGFVDPVIVQKKGMILIGGHQRVRALRELIAAGTLRDPGEVPATVLDVDDATAKQLNIALNRIGGSFDNAKLAAVIAEIYSQPNFDRVVLGLSALDLDRLLDTARAPMVDEDDVPDVPKKPVTRYGDRWTLGDHTLVCSDSREEGLWAGVDAEMVWTDPPYGVAYVGGSHGYNTKERLARGGKAIENDALNAKDLQLLLTEALGRAHAVTKAGGAWFVAAPVGPLQQVFGAVTLELGVWIQTLIWRKDQLVLGRSDFHYMHEPIFYGWKQGAPHRFRGDRKQTSLLEFPRPKRSKEHPTMKPVKLVEYCLQMGSGIGDLVVDPFGGSGTTLIAAEHSERRCFMVELSPGYCDVIVDRWQKMTGRSAHRTSVGGTKRPSKAKAKPAKARAR